MGTWGARALLTETTTSVVTVYANDIQHTCAMKTKLTITIDRDLLRRAKRYAGEQRVSLSSLIESTLRDLVDVGSTFTGKWRGRLELAERDDDRFKALLEKYGDTPRRGGASGRRA